MLFWQTIHMLINYSDIFSCFMTYHKYLLNFLAVVDRKHLCDLCDWAGDDSVVTSWKPEVTEHSGPWGELKGGALSPVASDTTESTGKWTVCRLIGMFSVQRLYYLHVQESKFLTSAPALLFPSLCSAGDQTLGSVCAAASYTPGSLLFSQHSTSNLCARSEHSYP